MHLVGASADAQISVSVIWPHMRYPICQLSVPLRESKPRFPKWPWDFHVSLPVTGINLDMTLTCFPPKVRAPLKLELSTCPSHGYRIWNRMEDDKTDGKKYPNEQKNLFELFSRYPWKIIQIGLLHSFQLTHYWQELSINSRSFFYALSDWSHNAFI